MDAGLVGAGFYSWQSPQEGVYNPSVFVYMVAPVVDTVEYDLSDPNDSDGSIVGFWWVARRSVPAQSKLWSKSLLSCRDDGCKLTVCPGGMIVQEQSVGGRRDLVRDDLLCDCDGGADQLAHRHE